MNKEEKEQEKKELGAMFDALEGGGVQTDAPSTDPPAAKTEPPSTDEPKTDPPTKDEPKTDAPETDAPKTDAPETDAPKTEAPTTDAPDDLDQIKKDNEELRRKIDELSAPKTKPPTTTAPATDPPIEEQDFVGKIDLEDVARSPEEFNKLLNKIYSKAVTDTRLEFKNYNKSTLEKVPALVSDNVSVQQKLKALTDNFYKENPDLDGFKKVVSTVFDELVVETPNDPYDKVLSKVGDEVRKRLELKKVKKEPKGKRTPAPPLPRKKGRTNRPVVPKGDTVADEIGTMNESLNR